VIRPGGPGRAVGLGGAPRAAHEGWIREGLTDDLPVRQRGREGRGSWLQRFRGRRAGPEPLRRGPVDAADEPLEAPVLPYAEDGAQVYVADVAPALAPPPPAPVQQHPAAERREPRTVHAVPTNADMKRARAVEVFNASEHPRTVAGIARSLGQPFVVVRPSDTEGSIVTVVIGWELCWYRYEVDLADEAAGVRVTGQGDEISELDAPDQVPNAAADERGELALVTG
jgi:hypothetical protein